MAVLTDVKRRLGVESEQSYGIRAVRVMAGHTGQFRFLLVYPEDLLCCPDRVACLRHCIYDMWFGPDMRMTCITKRIGALDKEGFSLGNMRPMAGRTHAAGYRWMHIGFFKRSLVMTAQTETRPFSHEQLLVIRLVRPVAACAHTRSHRRVNYLPCRNILPVMTQETEVLPFPDKQFLMCRGMRSMACSTHAARYGWMNHLLP